MSRTILYSVRSAKPTPSTESPITFGGPTRSRTKGCGARRVEEAAVPDDYAGKLVKFVPAEVLAFFAPMAAAVESRNSLLIAATIIGFLATPAYLWYGAQKLPPEQKPLVHLYPLSAIAFLTWALGTSSIGSLIGLDSITTSFILGTSVFLIPLVDGLLERVRQ